MAEQYTKIAIGDIGTQLFYYNSTTNKFEYALPVTAGAEFGGDTESFDAPETDLDYVPKVIGRRSTNDVEYTINYTKDKYKRAVEIVDDTNPQTYMEIFSDGSAEVFQGTGSTPSITAGDVRQITMTIIPSYMQWIYNVFSLTEDEASSLTGLGLGATFTASAELPIDTDTIPTVRQEYHTEKNTSST